MSATPIAIVLFWIDYNVVYGASNDDNTGTALVI
jgi:hypothetical protein